MLLYYYDFRLESWNINISVMSGFIRASVLDHLWSVTAPSEPITVWWVTRPRAWLNLPAHVQKSVSLSLHMNPSCERKRFPNSITHFILDQSIISCALQTWVPCTQWSIRLLKAQSSKLSLDLRDHLSYDAFRCWTPNTNCWFYHLSILDGRNVVNFNPFHSSCLLRPFFMSCSCTMLHWHDALYVC